MFFYIKDEFKPGSDESIKEVTRSNSNTTLFTLYETNMFGPIITKLDQDVSLHESSL